MDVLTTIEAEMKLRAVLHFKSFDCQIGAHEESYGLQHQIQINALFSMASSRPYNLILIRLVNPTRNQYKISKSKLRNLTRLIK